MISARSAGLLARYFEGGAGPSHSRIEVIWASADASEYLPEEGSKSKRVLGGLTALRAGRDSDDLPPDTAKLRDVVQLLLEELFPEGEVGNAQLRVALERDDLHFDNGELTDGTSLPGASTPRTPQRGPGNGPRHDHTGVFLVHGHDARRLREVEKLLESLVDEVIVLADQPNRGLTVVEKFLENAGRASMAVVLLTGDDEGRKVGDGSLTRRGRQNVIFEMGFFFASLGRDRVIVLYEPGVELPSDVAGLMYLSLDGSWTEELRRELGAAGITA